jgi:AraC family transcriptional regulator of adaptative response/methylated-DNA-[protein]-cysteine methyltransferase
MPPDPDTLYAALAVREDRFAGTVLVCVTTTGIYCRLGCPARTPLRRNVEFRGGGGRLRGGGLPGLQALPPVRSLRRALIASFGRSSRQARRRPTAREG